MPLLYTMTRERKIGASEMSAEPVNMRLKFQSLHSRYRSSGAQTMAEAMREATTLAEQTRSQCESLINEKRALESALNRVRTSF